MLNPLSETTFEAHIANYLANSDLYNQRSSAQFDIERLCDAEMLEQFLTSTTHRVEKAVATLCGARGTDGYP